MVRLTNYLFTAMLVNMTKIVKLYEAKTYLSSLVDRAANGEEFIIAKGTQLMARLVPMGQRSLRRTPGGWEGRLHVATDFDEPLPDDILRKFDSPE